MDVLVKKVTSLPKTGDVLDVDSLLLAPIKQACKSSADSTNEVFYYASMDLKKRSGAVRIRTLLLIDCLVHRSKLFRELVCADIKQIASCMGLLIDDDQNASRKTQGIDRSVSPVTSFLVELESKGKELIEIWDHLYGDRYPQLRALARYLRETLRLQMPNIMENARLHAERGERAKQHSENLLLLQKDKILESEWSSSYNEWTTSLARLEECFRILFPRVGVGEDIASESLTIEPSTLVPNVYSKATDDFEDVNWIEEEEHESHVEVRSSGKSVDEFSQVGASSSTAGVAPYTLTIQLTTAARDLETADNAVMVQTIRELSRVLARAAVPRLLQWKDIFVRCSALYSDQLALLQHVQVPVLEATRDDAQVGQVDEASDVSGIQSVSSTAKEDSVLGKRSAVNVSSDYLSVADSPALTKLLSSKNLVDQRLAQVISLLRNIRVMLTGKCRDLLKDEFL